MATRNQTPGEIITERARMASEGSCKTCQYCEPLPEPVRGYVAQCVIQGNVNAILFTSEDLERKAFPYICDCGWCDFHHSIICQAYVERVRTPAEQREFLAQRAIEEARERDERRREDTCLDEQKTAELWAKSEPRYYVDLVTIRYPGYKEVTFGLFHREMSDEEICRLVVFADGRTIDDLTYPRSHVEQTFSKAEVRQLYEYFSQHYEGDRLKVKRAGPPDNNCMGFGAYPVGGGTDFYTFSDADDYSLPFKVWGYFDLRVRAAIASPGSPPLAR